MNLIKNNFIFLDEDIKNREEIFEKVAEIAFKQNIVSNKERLIKAFIDRENLITTALNDEFSIPHARIKEVNKTTIFFYRLKNAIDWDEKNKAKQIILILVPEDDNSYLDTLSKIATKLLNVESKKILKTSDDVNKIVSIFELSDEELQSMSYFPQMNEESKTIVGITACATGVVHTYLAAQALIEAGKRLNYNVFIETQGQKGAENILTEEQISKAEAVILAVDIGVEKDRFFNKKVYQIGTKQAIKNPELELQNALEKSQVLGKTTDAANIFSVKSKKKWIGHIMNGISFMIPFIVFAGLVSAIVGGIAFSLGINLNTDYKDLINDTEKFLKMVNDFAGIGFTVMMGIAGAYIASSIAGRAAIAPAFILTMMGNNTQLVWKGYFENVMINGIKSDNIWGPISINETMQPLGIFGAIIFGLAVGYTVQWINTKWKINKFIQPIMPIIIIPVFLTLFFGVIWMFTFGPLVSIAVGYVYTGLLSLQHINVGMALLGLILGVLAGTDYGGPINKIASFGSTAIMSIDGGLAMGCAAAAFAVAPMGSGLAALIFRKKFKDDKAIAINATIMGFMGISESAIPFAVKYTWATMASSMIASGITGMFVGIFGVSGKIGAWGGPIIAIFGGTPKGQNILAGIPLYLAATAIGVGLYIVLFRVLVEIQSTKKLDKDTFKTIFVRNKKIIESEINA